MVSAPVTLPAGVHRALAHQPLLWVQRQEGPNNGSALCPVTSYDEGQAVAIEHRAFRR